MQGRLSGSGRGSVQRQLLVRGQPLRRARAAALAAALVAAAALACAASWASSSGGGRPATLPSLVARRQRGARWARWSRAAALVGKAFWQARQRLPLSSPVAGS